MDTTSIFAFSLQMSDTIYCIILFYSGLPSDIEHFLSSGADKVLLKPLDTEAFGKAMKEIRIH